MSYGTNFPVHHDAVQPPLYGQGLLILWGKVDTTTVAEDKLNEWWTNEHLPERIQLPGFIRARRYCGSAKLDGTKNYLACYEASALEALYSDAYMHALDNPTSGTREFMPHLAKMNRSACSVICSKSRSGNGNFARGLVGNCLLNIVFYFQARPGMKEDEFIKHVSWPCSIRALSQPGVLNFHLVLHDEAATQAGSTSKSYDGVHFDQLENSGETQRRKYIALIEFNIPGSPPSPTVTDVAKAFIDQITPFGGCDATWEAYQLICSMDLNAINANKHSH